MTLSSKYSPQLIEQKYYKIWQQQELFSPIESKKAYTMLMPPPNITGSLHMGHVLNNTIQDVLARRMRMKGQAVCWVPGLDHASIATEAKVVEKLKKEGKDKKSIGRKAFLQAAHSWKDTYGSIILEQLKALGVSADWKRTTFTMDETRTANVMHAFKMLYDADLIYRGTRMVNWDTEACTALSDEEVYYKELDEQLYYIAYPIEHTQESILVATTRPETLLGDVALCVHPADERYKYLQGKYALLPLLGRKLPIIADTYVDKDFGTGCLKITPAHDPNDYLLAEKHNLPLINILDEQGRLTPEAQLFVGENCAQAKKHILAELRAKAFLKKEENYKHKVGFSERTGSRIEPRVSKQWYCAMKKLAAPALSAVMNNEIIFYPSYLKNIYKRWMESIKDWCISRQLWWGHRIPIWYADDEQAHAVCAFTEAEAEKKFEKKGIVISHLSGRKKMYWTHGFPLGCYPCQYLMA